MQRFVEINSGKGVLLVTGSYSFQTGEFAPTNQATLCLPNFCKNIPIFNDSSAVICSILLHFLLLFSTVNVLLEFVVTSCYS